MHHSMTREARALFRLRARRSCESGPLFLPLLPAARRPLTDQPAVEQQVTIAVHGVPHLAAALQRPHCRLGQGDRQRRMGDDLSRQLPRPPPPLPPTRRPQPGANTTAPPTAKPGTAAIVTWSSDSSAAELRLPTAEMCLSSSSLSGPGWHHPPVSAPA